MTFGQLLDEVMGEAGRYRMTLDRVEFERHHRAITAVAFVFTEKDATARFVVTEREVRRGCDFRTVEMICGSAKKELARQLYDTPAAHAPGFMDA